MALPLLPARDGHDVHKRLTTSRGPRHCVRPTPGNADVDARADPDARANPTPTPAGCYPLTNSGGCYEPGEYCRVDDYGASGVAGDGEAITCEYNNGWRWEPSPTPTPAPTPTPVPTPTPTPAGCYPLTNSGNCYEPGEYCRADDYGTSGVAGDGEAITCEYNNGWRWEPT